MWYKSSLCYVENMILIEGNPNSWCPYHWHPCLKLNEIILMIISLSWHKIIETKMLYIHRSIKYLHHSWSVVAFIMKWRIWCSTSMNWQQRDDHLDGLMRNPNFQIPSRWRCSPVISTLGCFWNSYPHNNLHSHYIWLNVWRLCEF